MGAKKSDGCGGGVEKKKESPVTVVLKIDMHCKGYASKIVKTLKDFQGVDTVKLEYGAEKLTVVGKVDPSKLREQLAGKLNKKVDLISPQPKKEKVDDNNKKQPEKAKDDKKPEERKYKGKQQQQQQQKGKSGRIKVIIEGTPSQVGLRQPRRSREVEDVKKRPMKMLVEGTPSQAARFVTNLRGGQTQELQRKPTDANIRKASETKCYGDCCIIFSSLVKVVGCLSGVLSCCF